MHPPHRVLGAQLLRARDLVPQHDGGLARAQALLARLELLRDKALLLGAQLELLAQRRDLLAHARAPPLELAALVLLGAQLLERVDELLVLARKQHLPHVGELVARLGERGRALAAGVALARQLAEQELLARRPACDLRLRLRESALGLGRLPAGEARLEGAVLLREPLGVRLETGPLGLRGGELVGRLGQLLLAQPALLLRLVELLPHRRRRGLRGVHLLAQRDDVRVRLDHRALRADARLSRLVQLALDRRDLRDQLLLARAVLNGDALRLLERPEHLSDLRRRPVGHLLAQSLELAALALARLLAATDQTSRLVEHLLQLGGVRSALLRRSSRHLGVLQERASHLDRAQQLSLVIELELVALLELRELLLQLLHALCILRRGGAPLGRALRLGRRHWWDGQQDKPPETRCKAVAGWMMIGCGMAN